MSDTDKLAIVNRIAEILGQSGGKIATEFTHLVFAQAIAWLLVAIAALVFLTQWHVASVALNEHGHADDMVWLTFYVSTAVKWIGVMWAIAMIAYCLPELYAPRAVAISRLLGSLSGASE